MDRYLIWSTEHRAWWKPFRNGYTTRTDKAGQYSLIEAMAILEDANRHSKVVEEIMVEAPSQAQLACDMEWIT